MTAPRESGIGEAAPTPWGLLVLPYFVIFIAAALTDEFQLQWNQGDVGLYLEKALGIASGLTPYRDFPLEYPPLALVPMVVPAFLWPFGTVTIDLYKWLFAGWEAVLILALGYVLVRIARLTSDGEDGARLRSVALRLLVLSLGAALAIAFRFDMFPTLLMMVAVWAALENRPGAAGLAIGLGIVAKLFPLAIVPALAVRWLVPFDQARFVRFGLVATAAVAGVMLPALAFGGSESLLFLHYQLERGLQVESIGGGLTLLAGLLSGVPANIVHAFASVQVAGAFASAWLTVLPITTVVGFALLGVIGWRRIQAEVRGGGIQAATVVTLAFASILVLIVTSKVFSIQYVVWIVPFAALLRGRAFWLAAIVVGLTMPIHPIFYADLVGQAPLAILLLNLRNALVVLLLGVVLWNVARPAGLEPTTFRSAT